jgi:hypothetical protein
LRQKIVPARKLDVADVKRLVDDLDANEFRVRSKAISELRVLGYSAEPLLRHKFKTDTRVEVKLNLQKLIDELSGVQLLRTQRALEVLAAIHDAEATKLLRELAAGAPGNVLTDEAAKRLKRLLPTREPGKYQCLLSIPGGIAAIGRW